MSRAGHLHVSGIGSNEIHIVHNKVLGLGSGEAICLLT